MTETTEQRFAARFAIEGKRLRVGCNRCDFVGDIVTPQQKQLEDWNVGTGFVTPTLRPTEAEIHGFNCPECDQRGGMHHYPIAGTWPSEYDDRCPLADETQP